MLCHASESDYQYCLGLTRIHIESSFPRGGPQSALQAFKRVAVKRSHRSRFANTAEVPSPLQRLSDNPQQCYMLVLKGSKRGRRTLYPMETARGVSGTKHLHGSLEFNEDASTNTQSVCNYWSFSFSLNDAKALEIYYARNSSEGRDTKQLELGSISAI